MFSRADKPIGDISRASRISVDEQGAAASEHALIDAAKRLEEAAWEEIYERHARHVYSYMYLRVRDQQVAEDLAADVFVRALGGIEGYEWRGTPLLAWLYRIAHNVSADHLKRAAKTAQRQVDELPIAISDQTDHMGASDEQSDMLNAVRKLTPDQQQVIILRFYMGMTTRQAARVVGKPQSAVKALQSRALRTLRRLLTDTSEELKSA